MIPSRAVAFMALATNPAYRALETHDRILSLFSAVATELVTELPPAAFHPSPEVPTIEVGYQRLLAQLGDLVLGRLHTLRETAKGVFPSDIPDALKASLQYTAQALVGTTTEVPPTTPIHPLQSFLEDLQ